MGETIRAYRESDLEALRRITAVCFDGVSIDRNIEDAFGLIGDVDWTRRKLAEIDDDVAAHPNGIFVADVDGISAGYITTRINEQTKIGRIPNLAVDPEFQGSGLGRKLIEHALAYFKSEGMLCAKIETLEQNEIGSAFYPSMGFVEVAKQIHYVRRLEDV